MEELVTTEQASRVIWWMALTLPIAGLTLGALLGIRRRKVLRSALYGVLVGHIGPLTWVLWQAYNWIMGHFGLDSVAGLLINLVLFAAIGLAIGIGVGLARRRLTAPTLDAGSDT